MRKLYCIQVYSGASKGKSTAAFGLALRAVACDFKILIIQFLKGDPNISYGEVKSCEIFKDNITIKQAGITGVVNSSVLATNKKDNIINKTNKIWEYTLKEINTKKYDMVILDEILPSLDLGLVDLNEFKSFIETKRKYELVLTGRMAKPEIINYITEIADYFTKMKCIKHPYNKNCIKCQNVFMNDEYIFEFCPYCGEKLKQTMSRKGIEY